MGCGGSKPQPEQESTKGKNVSNAAGTSMNPFDMQAQMLQAKIPEPQPLTKLLNEIVFAKSFSEANKDILRLIRRVSIVKPGANDGEDYILNLSNVDFPESLELDKSKQPVYLVLVLMKELLAFFETPEVAEDLCQKLDQCFFRWQESFADEATKDSVDFNTISLLTAIGGDTTRTALAVRCIDQSIAISGHMHIKSKIAPDFTKDVPEQDGWKVQFTLAEYVQVKHTRKERSAMAPKGSEWAMEYDVHLTFDKEMSEITATKLTITNFALENPDTVDPQMKAYLDKRFNGGNLVVT